MSVRRVFVTVALDVDRDWYDGLVGDLDMVQPYEVVAALVKRALRDWEHIGVTVVRCEGSELP